MPRVHPLPSPADGAAGWNRLLPPAPPPTPLAGEVVADFAVVGGGFTGVAAARRLAELEPSARVVLLEAARVGEGPSGRNSGFVIDLPHVLDASAPEDVAANARVRRLARAGVAELRAQVARHGIACDWAELGKIHAAAGGRSGAAALDALARGLERIEEPFEPLEAARLEALLGTRHYARGLFTPGCVLVQPAALVRGLARALPASVAVHEESPVVALEREDASWRLSTPAGAVRAREVLLATDAFTRAFGFLRTRLVPVYTYASLTAPVPAGAGSKLGGAPAWALLPAHKAGATLRRLADGRLLVRSVLRQGAALRSPAAALEAARADHARALAARFPGAPLALEHTWGGVVCFTRNFVPFFGRLPGGPWAFAGTNGVGVAKGTAYGRLLAEAAVGHASSLLDDARAFPPPSWVPPRPLLDLAVGARLALAAREAGADA